jgi:hypothetical protein
MQKRSNHIPFRSAFLFFLLLIITSSVAAQSADSDLNGLKGVSLAIMLEHDTEDRLGLKSEEAYQAVADEFRKAGVKFLPWPKQYTLVGPVFEKMPADYGMLYFEVATVAEKAPLGIYALDIRYDFLDRVRLSRDGSIETVGSILKKHELFLMRGREGHEVVLQRLRAMGKNFAGIFKASNPETNKP